MVGIFAGLLVFLGRLYLESYYSYFGIPPSALHLEVQDYTFVSFPLVLFVLMLSAGVILYWRAIPTGWLGNILTKIIHIWWSNFKKGFQGRARRSIKPVRGTRLGSVAILEHKLQAGETKLGIVPLVGGTLHTATKGVVAIIDFIRRLLRFVSVMAVYILPLFISALTAYVLPIFVSALIFLVVLSLIIAFIAVVISVLGIDFSLGLVNFNILAPSWWPDEKVSTEFPTRHWLTDIRNWLYGWTPPNIPGLRGLFSGVLIAIWAIVVISIFEAFLPVRLKEWAAPAVLVCLTIVVMPLVTYFMAKDQAIADLGDTSGWFRSALPVASFESELPLKNGNMWEGASNRQHAADSYPQAPCSFQGANTAQRTKGGLPQQKNCQEYYSPWLRIVVINEGVAYVVLDDPDETLPEGQGKLLYTIAMDDVDAITYRSPVMERRVRPPHK